MPGPTPILPRFLPFLRPAGEPALAGPASLACPPPALPRQAVHDDRHAHHAWATFAFIPADGLPGLAAAVQPAPSQERPVSRPW